MSEKVKRPKKPKKIIGRAEQVTFKDFNGQTLPGRIDTGAKTSSVWATNIREQDGLLSFALLGAGHPDYTGETHKTHQFWKTAVASSMGNVQERYVVRLAIKMRGRKIIARFTLADRSTQVYPVLVGRNVLRGKFLVDVKIGKPDRGAEEARTAELQSHINP